MPGVQCRSSDEQECLEADRLPARGRLGSALRLWGYGQRRLIRRPLAARRRVCSHHSTRPIVPMSEQSEHAEPASRGVFALCLTSGEVNDRLTPSPHVNHLLSVNSTAPILNPHQARLLKNPSRYPIRLLLFPPPIHTLPFTSHTIQPKQLPIHCLQTSV